MPELAEVQTLADALHRVAAGQQIRALDLHVPSWLKRQDDLDHLPGRSILAVDRWGKRLRFRLAGDPQGWLVSGLGMTGGWLLRDDAPPRHLIASLELANGSILDHVDPRRFGQGHLFASPEQAEALLGPRIGVDAAAELTAEQLQQIVGRGRVALKAALLDQARLAGIGNYLADEMAWDAQLAPTRSVAELSAEDWQRLNRARREVIARALAAQGLSFADYRHLDGGEGQMSAQLRAYGRAGQPCLRCHASLVKTTVAGRGTHFCVQCQR